MPKQALLFCLALSFANLALAHESQLSGLVYMQPQNPSPNEPFTLTAELISPEGAFVPNAILALAIEDTLEPLRLTETQYTGVYQAQLSLPEGRWRGQLSDSTFEGELNIAEFGLHIGSSNLELIEVLFPANEETTSTLRINSWLIAGLSILFLAILGLGLNYQLKAKHRIQFIS